MPGPAVLSKSDVDLPFTESINRELVTFGIVEAGIAAYAVSLFVADLRLLLKLHSASFEPFVRSLNVIHVEDNDRPAWRFRALGGQFRVRMQSERGAAR